MSSRRRERASAERCCRYAPIAQYLVTAGSQVRPCLPGNLRQLLRTRLCPRQADQIRGVLATSGPKMFGKLARDCSRLAGQIASKFLGFRISVAAATGGKQLAGQGGE